MLINKSHYIFTRLKKSSVFLNIIMEISVKYLVMLIGYVKYSIHLHLYGVILFQILEIVQFYPKCVILNTIFLTIIFYHIHVDFVSDDYKQNI